MKFRLLYGAGVMALLLGCRDGAPARIGDANPRASGAGTIVELIETQFATLAGPPRVLVERWSPAANASGLEAEVRQAHRFDSVGVTAVVGHAGSRESLIGASIYNVRHIPQVVPTGTSRLLALAGPWTFRLAPNDSVEGDFIAQVAVDSFAAKVILIVYVGDEYGIGLRDGIIAGLRRRGVTQVTDVRAPEITCLTAHQRRATTAVIQATLARTKPDLVALAVRTAIAPCIIAQIHDAMPATRFLVGDGVQFDAAAMLAAPAARRGLVAGIEFWHPDTTDARIRIFLANAKRILGRAPTSTEALTVDAFAVVGAAIQATGGEREAVRAWLASLGVERPPWSGVTGPIAFTGERRHLLHLRQTSVLPQ